jgi:protein transport protein YIF1
MFGENPDGNMMMQLGLSYGQRVFQEGEKGLSKYLPILNDVRRYFRVNNQYVKKKLLMILFPFNKQFSRQQFQFEDDSGAAGSNVVSTQLPPTDDVCSFDLYIPLMALITYVTICGFVRGINQGSLGADFLASTLTSIFFWVFLEVAVIKIFRYIMNLPQTFAALDIVALCGYKYVGVSLLVLFRETFALDGHWLALLSTLYIAAAAAFFAFRAMSEFYSRDGKVPVQARPLVYGAAGLQIPFVLWFSMRPF